MLRACLCRWAIIPKFAKAAFSGVTRPAGRAPPGRLPAQSSPGQPQGGGGGGCSHDRLQRAASCLCDCHHPGGEPPRAVEPQLRERGGGPPGYARRRPPGTRNLKLQVQCRAAAAPAARLSGSLAGRAAQLPPLAAAGCLRQCSEWSVTDHCTTSSSLSPAVGGPERPGTSPAGGGPDAAGGRLRRHRAAPGKVVLVA